MHDMGHFTKEIVLLKGTNVDYNKGIILHDDMDQPLKERSQAFHVAFYNTMVLLK